MPSPTEPAAPARGFLRAFQDLPREHGFEPLRVEGRLPGALQGTLYRVGPALFSSFGRRYGHWFDGDGAVAAVRFGDGRAEGAVRLVQSEELRAERRAGRALYAGYGTRPPGLRRLYGGPKNGANTAVLDWQGRLFALWEGGLPTELARDDLATRGTTDLGGVVPRTFSAHPHRVPSRRAAYNFGVRYGRRTLLDLFVLPDEGPARRLATLPLAGATMIHDFVATERHLVFFAPPLRLNLLALLSGARTYDRALQWRPELGTEVLVLPIDAPGQAVRFTVEPFFQWHFANAFEDDGELVVDLARYPDFSSNDFARSLPTGAPVSRPLATLVRATLDLAGREARFEELSDLGCEFPRIAPEREGGPYRLVYVAQASAARMAQAGPPDGLARIDVASRLAERVGLGEARTVSEPVFVARPGSRAEDDGWLLTLVYDAARHASFVAVLDARRLGDGPLALAWYDHHIPLTFHGIFSPR